MVRSVSREEMFMTQLTKIIRSKNKCDICCSPKRDKEIASFEKVNLNYSKIGYTLETDK